MKKIDKNIEPFYALLRAGLWENNISLLPFEQLDYSTIYKLAKEQCAIGLVAAGFKYVMDTRVPQDVLLSFIGSALQIEQRNKAMNDFVAKLFSKLRRDGVDAVLVKGQGVAQCYHLPLWRVCGDVDLLFNSDNYEKAKKTLIPMATHVMTEYTYFKHLAMTINGWVVELHGTRQTRLSRRIDSELDAIQDRCFKQRDFRTWLNGETAVPLPNVDADVMFIFTHILHHFFFEGVGVRQICDWCRLLWKYRDEIDVRLLKERLMSMRLMTEWKAFSAYAVEWLGMPADAMPLYEAKSHWSRKAASINEFVMKVGNFGHNNKKISSHFKLYLVRKFVSFGEHLGFVLRQFMIFPVDSVRFLWEVMRSGLYGVLKGQ